MLNVDIIPIKKIDVGKVEVGGARKVASKS